MAHAEPLVLITRPRAASERFAEALRAASPVDILIAPVIEIEPVGNVVASDRFAAVIFTSGQAVSRTRGYPDQTAYCVGEATASLARDAGFDAVSADGNSDDLVTRVLLDHPKGQLLHVRGADVSANIAARLRAAGLKADEAIAYRQTNRALSEAEQSRIASAPRVIAPVFSPRSAGRLAEELKPRPGLTVVAISPAAADAWSGEAEVIRIAARPTAVSMLEAVTAVADSDSQCGA